MPRKIFSSVTITGPQEDRDRLKRLVEGETPFDLNKVIPMPDSLNTGLVIRWPQALALVEFRDAGHSDLLTKMLKWTWVTKAKIQSEAQLADALERQDEQRRAQAKHSGIPMEPGDELPLVEHGSVVLQNMEQYGVPTWEEWRQRYWGTTSKTYDCTLISASKESLKYKFYTRWNEPQPVFEKLKEMFPSLTIKIVVSGQVPQAFSYIAKPGMWDAEVPKLQTLMDMMLTFGESPPTDEANDGA
jgi:hypothetical protein